VHLTEKDAKAMGIEGAVDCGTVTLSGFMASRGPRGPDPDKVREAIKRANAAELKRRLEMELQGTTELVTQLKLVGIPEPRSLLHPDGQLKFHPDRRWRLDLAWEDVKLGVEIQGFGTHSSAKGLLQDTEKACEAAVLGWTVLPLLYRDVRAGRAVNWIEKVYHRLANPRV